MHMNSLHYSAFMLRHFAIIISKIRALLIPLHNISNVDTVREPLDVLLPRVMIVPQPSPKTSTAMETAGLISVPCKVMIEIDSGMCNVE